MANTTIQLQNQFINIQTVPGSGLIRVFLAETDNCFYNPASGLFSATPNADKTTRVLVKNHPSKLKQKLNEFDTNRRESFEKAKRLSPGT